MEKKKLKSAEEINLFMIHNKKSYSELMFEEIIKDIDERASHGFKNVVYTYTEYEKQLFDDYIKHELIKNNYSVEAINYTYEIPDKSYRITIKW